MPAEAPDTLLPSPGVKFHDGDPNDARRALLAPQMKLDAMFCLWKKAADGRTSRVERAIQSVSGEVTIGKYRYRKYVVMLDGSFVKPAPWRPYSKKAETWSEVKAWEWKAKSGDPNYPGELLHEVKKMVDPKELASPGLTHYIEDNCYSPKEESTMSVYKHYISQKRFYGETEEELNVLVQAELWLFIKSERQSKSLPVAKALANNNLGVYHPADRSFRAHVFFDAC